MFGEKEEKKKERERERERELINYYSCYIRKTSRTKIIAASNAYVELVPFVGVYSVLRCQSL